MSAELESPQPDAATSSVTAQLWLPPIYAIDELLVGNRIQQLLLPERSMTATMQTTPSGPVTWRIATPIDDENSGIALVVRGVSPPGTIAKVLEVRQANQSPSRGTARWIRHPLLAQVPVGTIDYPACVEQVVNSWRQCFTYMEEDTRHGIAGLRAPQIGAVHAMHGHWSTTNQAATIVMPTGTGKTDTMLSILVSAQCKKLLVVVPTDALRTQLYLKFLTFGVLKDSGVVGASALYPIVGMLKRRPKDPQEVDDFFTRCNVVVATAQIVGQCGNDVQSRMADHCPYLFIDEAHHVAAATWHEFKQRFEQRRIVQFTATPFRNDGKLLGGKIIYNFPLRLALDQGYFKQIRFEPVVEFDRHRADEAIAAKAVAQLRADLQAGYDHIVMARVESIVRAEEVYAIYARYSEFKPVQIHTGISSKNERDRVRSMILERDARIVVCVDMLGEGFDLPELKIAAFHDVKKSLAVTLQLAGRFTRAKLSLGNPTFIANIGDVTVQEELRKLYMQDADWNALLMRSSEEIIADQISLREFLDGFGAFPDDIPLQNVRPALSTVIYRTSCERWTPERFLAGIPRHQTLDRLHHDINFHANVLVVVTAQRVLLDWAQLQEIHNWHWELLVVHWDEEQQILFINSSSNKGYYRELAQAVAGNVELICGPEVFRSFWGVSRLKLQNVGLAEQLGRLIRYTMRAGSDVETGLTEAQRRNARKSNIFGYGYENEEKVSVGCSYKGRIWSQRRGNLRSLILWCRSIGAKVLNDAIDPDQVLRGTLTPRPVSARPHKMPIGIEWPEVLYTEPETAFEFVIDASHPVPLYLTELRLVDPTEDGDLVFELDAHGNTVSFALILEDRDGMPDYRYECEAGRAVEIKHGGRQVPLAEFFYDNPPVLLFADGSSLEGNSLTELKATYPPYPVDRIRAWDWTGTDITKESQGLAKERHSIQYRVIQELKRDGRHAVIVDDDASGEVADVVAICVEERSLTIDLYHCKFSQEARPGSRVKDLYEVCGQAQKSVHWHDLPTELVMHLLRRERNRTAAGQASRLEKGSEDDLLRIAAMSRSLAVRLAIHVVQPGLSRDQASFDQLQLLSVTDNYLMETYKIPFAVVASS